MNDQTDVNDKPTKKSNGCLLFAGKAAIFLAGLYVLQWILGIIFNAPDSDSIANALRPFQNHYLSSSKYYVTTEGAIGEFTNDMTGVGRFLALLVPAGIAWLVILVITSLIKALKSYYGVIFWTVTVLICGIVFYSEFFVPYKKATFYEKEMVVKKSEWIFSVTEAHIPYTIIERFEYDFHKDHDVHTGDQMYAQIFVVVGDKRFIISEDQVAIETADFTPTAEQEKEVQATIRVLSKLVGKGS